jgi:hypothetical protein
MVRRYLSVVGFIIAFAYQGCSDDEVMDSQKPFVDFNSSDKVFSGTDASLSFDVRDDNALSRVEVYIDGQLIAAKDVAGDQALAYNVTWNTKIVADGNHIVSVKLKDTNENTTEETFSVVVRNVLYTYAVGPDVLLPEQRFFVFLSDRDGNAIATKELKNNSTTVFENEIDFQGEDFMLTLFSRTEYGTDYADQTMTTYTGVRPGRRELERIESITLESTKVIGSSTLNILNAPEGYTFQYTGSHVSDNHFVMAGGTATGDVPFSASTSDLFVIAYAWGKETKYVYLDEVRTEESITLSYADFKQYQDASLAATGGSDYMNISMAYRKMDDKFQPYFLGILREDDEMPLGKTAEDIFDRYYSETYFYVGDEYHYNNIMSAEMPTELKMVNADLVSYAFVGDDLKFSIKGQADLVELNGFAGLPSVGYSKWIYAKPDEAAHIKQPIMPKEITDLFNNVDPKLVQIANVTISDRQHVSSYDQFANEVEIESTSEYYHDAAKRYFIPNNGRTKTERKPDHSANALTDSGTRYPSIINQFKENANIGW